MAIAVLGTGVLLVSSCDKKFTEINPLNNLKEENAFSTAKNIDLTLNGMYWHAGVGYYNPGTGLVAGRGYPFGGASIEQGEMRGEDMVNLQAFYEITYLGNYTVTTANNVNHWEQLYQLINQANVIVDGLNGAVQKGVITKAIADPYEGEALFVRALAHHELLIHYSRPYADNNGSNMGIPYRTKGVTNGTLANEGLSVDRGTVASCYALLLSDLDKAETLLPNSQSNAALSISRATKGAAIALKTRIKLHMGDYPGVIDEGKKLGTDATNGSFTSAIGGYKLEANPVTPFVNFKANTESIFSVAQSLNSNGGVNGAITSMFSPSGLDGRDLIATSPNLYNASFWLSGDRRKTDLQYRQSVGTRQFVYNKKYTRYGINDDWNPILRYAEVLLNVAEAYAYQGNTAQALALLNAVRNRSVPAGAEFTQAPSDLKLAIYQERRIEFTGEGKRWSDVHRLALNSQYGTGGIPAKVRPAQLTGGLSIYDGSTILTPSYGAIAYSDHRFVWPLPTSEMDANPTLRAQQNPNY
ncbi:RagB/SusD family nutrient uptake outer membrane protein [Sphingobacterium tabacisoli]|uniref:RagB/SusD family nutrient uptake outer membrane protein n=2 Tax=Sphingobacterium tabacisoli TaxID=2044855 RepID=A0ABW5KVR3_9SPHI